MWTNTYDFHVFMYESLHVYPSIKCISYDLGWVLLLFSPINLLNLSVRETVSFNVSFWWANISYFSVSDKLLAIYSATEKQPKL